MAIAKEVILMQSPNRLGRMMYLTHKPAGLYIAGSGTRHDSESWGWYVILDNARHGQRYKTLSEAQDAYNARLPATGI